MSRPIALPSITVQGNPGGKLPLARIWIAELVLHGKEIDAIAHQAFRRAGFADPPTTCKQRDRQTPAMTSGNICSSSRVFTTPHSKAPSAPPPCRINTVCMGIWSSRKSVRRQIVDVAVESIELRGDYVDGAHQQADRAVLERREVDISGNQAF